MAKTKTQTTLYDYLHQTGILEHGDKQLIEKVKAAYWKSYHRQYKQQKRSQGKEYTVFLEGEEKAYFEKLAKQHHQSITSFLKQAAWAYLHQEFIFPDNKTLATLEQKLSLLYSEIDRLNQSKIINTKSIESALESLERMEVLLSQLLRHPQNLEMLITETIVSNPYYLSTLKQIISKYDH